MKKKKNNRISFFLAKIINLKNERAKKLSYIQGILYN